jgi:Cys-tRNA(Pro)/Cys-tRNA(Cys) deacylase
MVMAPVARLDLKVLAQALGEKRLRMATQKEAEKLTGMQVGGISALGLQRPGFTVLIDERRGRWSACTSVPGRAGWTSNWR